MRPFSLLLTSCLLGSVQASFFHKVNGVICKPHGFAASAQPQLTNVRTALVNVTGAPVSIQYVRNGSYALYSSDTTPGSIGVLDTTSFVPKLVASVPLNETSNGFSIDPDEKYLYATSLTGAYVIDIEIAITGSAAAVVKYINGSSSVYKPGIEPFTTQIFSNGSQLAIAFENGPATDRALGLTSATPGDIQFVSLETRPGSSNITAVPNYEISLGYAISGLALSPDGNLLYATSEQCDPILGSLPGYHSIFNVTQGQKQQLSNVFAGCTPVRALPSSDGKVVWSTSRGGNLVVAFDAAKMITDPGNAIIATVEVGTAPVGLILIENDTRLLVADSNRFASFGIKSVSGITVIDTEAALSGCGDANLGQIPTGLFPREFTVSPDGKTVLVANNLSGQVQAIDVSTLP